MYVSRVPSLVDKYAQTNSQGFRPRWQYRGIREVILRGWQPGCRRPRWQMRGQSVSKRSFPLGPRLGIVYCTCKMWAHCMSRLHYVTFVQRIRIHRDSTYCTHMGAQTAHIWMNACVCAHSTYMMYAPNEYMCMHTYTPQIACMPYKFCNTISWHLFLCRSLSVDTRPCTVFTTKIV